MNIVIIKYNAGNVQSVQFALQRLGFTASVSNNEAEILAADKVIFPGVGNAFAAMESLKENNLHHIIPQIKKPLLGICVGMQLLCTSSEENNTTGLGIINTTVKKFTSTHNEKVPQIGWNTISNYNSALLHNVPNNSYVYYVHSYYAQLCNNTVATTNYILPYSAIIQKDNFYGVQFHTEKSGKIGSLILQNFLNL